MNAKNEKIVERPPIVVVMGHVDHGKSTLLDTIRKSNTVEKEAGGITQHVAAYEAVHKDKRITFIDTPGHAAFTAIRARGANVADIAVLVVAADDGVKAQTLEALAQIRDSGIPFVVAINKIDKPNASVERTQGSLMEKGVYLEKLGGEVPWAAISAKSGTGVDELLDLILLVAEINEYKADASGPATGWVIEAHRDAKRGVAATLITTEGTLKSGMAVVAGTALSPVRIMEDHTGKTLKSASFSTPILLVGFDELPSVGERFLSFKSKRDAEETRSRHLQEVKSTAAATTTEDGTERFYLPLIVRADASGSLEAILQETARIGDEHSRISIVQSGIGNISEGDVKTALAGSTQGVVIGFNVDTDRTAEALIRQHSVRAESFNIIYKLTERVEELLKELRPKRKVEETLGSAKILKVFSHRKTGHTIGGKMASGYLEKRKDVRILRKGELVGTGFLETIQANRQNMDRVEEGEFGAQVETEDAIREGDVVECFRTVTE
jgi:translation initiation factor IF-2